MTALKLAPYSFGDLPAPRSVPVSVVILTKNEAANIERCLASVAWAAQVIVLDSESTDDTVKRAARAGAEVVIEPWRGFAAQREYALRLPTLQHDWVYFVDADEWISDKLAREIDAVIKDGTQDAYSQRFRLVFMNRWIRHCGWYGGSWIVRLMRASRAQFGSEGAGERAYAKSIGKLKNDIVDEDQKGLPSWLRKHIGYAEIEVQQQAEERTIAERWRSFRKSREYNSKPLARAIAKDLIYPALPAKPATIFLYMYVLQRGFLDGKPGLYFCFYHAWYRTTISALSILDVRNGNAGSATKGTPAPSVEAPDTPATT
jgi:glycosyltransferase involved in cell wall biosynthesis